MEVKHIILETNSTSELQALLDSNAKNGFKAISFSTYFDGNYGRTYYAALMERPGSLEADSK
jgi:hypothetical protein